MLFRGRVFGVKLIKKAKPTIEVGQRLRPEAQSDDIYVVIGITILRSGRKTAIQLLLMLESGDANVRTLDYDLLTHFFDQPDRFLDITAKSISQALIGRHLVGVLSNGKKELPNIPVGVVSGKMMRTKVGFLFQFLKHF